MLQTSSLIRGNVALRQGSWYLSRGCAAQAGTHLHGPRSRWPPVNGRRFCRDDVRQTSVPFWLDIAVSRFAEFIRGGFDNCLCGKRHSQSLVGERAVLCGLEEPSGIPLATRRTR